MEFKFAQEEHQNIIDNSRIGLKGYTIPKELLSNKTLDFLYKNLFVKPLNLKIIFKLF